MSTDELSTPAQRSERGRAARKTAPRSAHGDWEPGSDRPDPVAILEEQAKTRVDELIPLRYGRMLASPFAFFRGGAAIMAADLASTPATDIRVQACGDAHLSNFGGFAAPDRQIVFDINDFDETLPGPWEWDVKRLAASVEVACRDRGFGNTARRAAVTACARAYRERMRELARLGNLELWFQRLGVADVGDLFEVTSNSALTDLDRAIARARGKDRMKALAKLTKRTRDGLRFDSDPPLIMPIEEVHGEETVRAAKQALHDMVEMYRASLDVQNRRLYDSYTYVHAARKVVGVGSVGTRVWLVLHTGRDERDPLFLQLKEAQQSVLEPYAGRGVVKHQGHRVVRGQRLMQAAGDVLLGWMTADAPDGVKRDFYVRQFWDQKLSPRVERFTPTVMLAYADLCGQTLARGHARSGDRVAIASYLGAGDNFDKAILRFAELYADQNERDYSALKKAADDGRIKVAAEPT